MASASNVQQALDELATRLAIPADMITVHRMAGECGCTCVPRTRAACQCCGASSRSRPPEFGSLRYGAFLLTYGPLEAFFSELTGYRSGKNRTLPLNPDKIRDVVHQELGYANITRHWEARVRSAPPADATTNISPWLVLRGPDLRDYLADAANLRHRLAHGQDPLGATNTSRTLYPVQGGHSVRLMWVEGFLQAAQDIASQTALALAPQVRIPVWPEPPASGTSAARPPRPY